MIMVQYSMLVPGSYKTLDWSLTMVTVSLCIEVTACNFKPWSVAAPVMEVKDRMHTVLYQETLVLVPG